MNDNELTLAGMNVAEFSDRLMQNRALIPIFVKKFLSDGTYSSLCRAVEEGDMKAAESACHTFKGVCGNLSLTALFAKSREQLALFRAGEAESAVAMMPQLTALYETAVMHMQLWLKDV